MTGLTNFTSGTKANAEEVNRNLEGSFSAAHHAMIDGLRGIQLSSGSDVGTIDDQRRDIMSDTTGFLDSVDVGNTTAVYWDGFYAASVLGSAETAPSTDNNGVGNPYTISCTANTTGIITKVELDADGSDGTTTVTISQGGTTLATKTASNSGQYAVSFTEVDYLDKISSGTFTISISIAGGATNTTIRNTSASYAGTDFSYSGQTVPGATSGSSDIDFSDVTYSSKIVQTETLFSSGTTIDSIIMTSRKSDDGTNVITYDASSDNGSTYVTSQSLDTINSLSANNGNQLIVKFNIPGDSDAKLYGYAFTVGRET